MNRPPLSPVNVPQRHPGSSLPDLISFAAQAQVALKELSKRLAEHAGTIRQSTEGQNVVTGTVTLTANAASTTVTKDEIPADGYAFLFPRTANAAAEFGAGSIYTATTTKGQFVITHANDANSDKTFGWHVMKPG